MKRFISHSTAETEAFGAEFAQTLKGGDVVAMFGGMGMGKTAFVRGMAKGLEICAEVSSPTYAFVHEYIGSRISLYHFDMYRVNSWDDLDSTGFFHYIAQGGILAVEWSENIEGALPENAVYVRIECGETQDERVITVMNAGEY